MAKIKTSISEDVVSDALGAGAKFIITELTPDGPKPVYGQDGQLLTFKSGSDAARAAMLLSEGKGTKHQPRAVNDDTWREREIARCKAKDYLTLPWEKERWWVDLKDLWKDHYPHVSINNGAFVAYTESPEKGAADVQTRIKPGKYLEKHFAEVLNQYVIRDLCTAFAEKYEDNMLQWAVTADEIEDVYVNGPSSCMSKTVGNYKSGKIHPVRVYAAGDLQVVYLKKTGRVSARALCWPEKKIYSTIYGDKGRLEPLLTKLGYKCQAPFGARIEKIKVPAPQDKFHYVVPHIDNVGWVKADGDVLRIGDSWGSEKPDAINADGAVGITELLGYECKHCDSSDFTQRRIVSVFYNASKAQNWCVECAKKDAVQCSVTGYWVNKDQLILIDGDKPMWSRLQTSHGFVCQKTGRTDWAHNRVIMEDGSYWSKAAVAKHGYVCKCGKTLPSQSACTDKCRTEFALVSKKAQSARDSDGYRKYSKSGLTGSWL